MLGMKISYKYHLPRFCFHFSFTSEIHMQGFAAVILEIKVNNRQLFSARREQKHQQNTSKSKHNLSFIHIFMIRILLQNLFILFNRFSYLPAFSQRIAKVINRFRIGLFGI